MPRTKVPNHRPQNKGAKRKRCIDCEAEGIATSRKAGYPGPRCYTHNKAQKSSRRKLTQEQRWLKVYGITAEEYWKIYEYQGGVCYICRRATGKGRRKLSVDHCHETGIVRGLLCNTDNAKVLGHARDDIEFFERCIEYLNHPPAVDVIGWREVP